MVQKSRNSSFELLRLLAQLLIVLYHLCYIWQGFPNNRSPFFQGISILLHIGVIIFVLLSGYFSIKPSSKGLIKLIGIFFVYSSVETVHNIYHADSILQIIKSLFFLSTSHYWFIKTYLFLYLSSPLINKWNENSSIKEKWYLVFVFGFVASYMALTGGDSTMHNGKNLVNFIFIYLCGNQLSYYKNMWNKIKWTYILGLYLLINAIIMVGMMSQIPFITKTIYNCTFQYSSPILIFDAILLFMVFGQIKIQSKAINYLASSSLAIYLIHSIRPFMPELHSTICNQFQLITNNNYYLLFLYLIYSIIIILGCISIDKLLTPIWKAIDILGVKIYNKIGS